MDETTYRAAEAKLFDAYGVTPREHVIDVPSHGCALRVLELGEGEPLLFVHGSPNTAATWIPLAKELPNRRCLLLERPGAGLSTPVRRWTSHREDVVALVSAVLDALGIAALDVVGSSFGGLYAYALATLAPARVRRLVLMGAPIGPVVLPIPGIFRFLSLPLPLGLFKNAMRLDVAKSRKMWSEIGHGPSIQAGVIPEVMFEWHAALVNHTNTMEHLLGEIRAIATPFGLRAGARFSAEELARIDKPTLYLWGDRDTFASPARGERASALTQGARLECLPGFGHLPWVDDPALIAQRLIA